MSMNFLRLWCITLDLIEKCYFSGEWLLLCSDKSLLSLRLNEKLDYNQQVLSCISQGSVLGTEILNILRRKRSIYYEELGAPQIVGRFGGET